MSETLAGTDDLIARLTSRVEPVRRLSTPWRRAALFLAAAAWLGLILALFTDFDALRNRLMGAPDMAASAVGALLTAMLATLAAFETSVPGRSARWALLPLPAAALWIGASGAGCLRHWAVPGTEPEPAMHPMICLYFLLAVSLPLSILLIALLVRACPLRPALTAWLAGLASAGASATLLTLIHPFDATAEDLGVHLAAVLLVLGGTRLFGARAVQANLSGAVHRPWSYDAEMTRTGDRP